MGEVDSAEVPGTDPPTVRPVASRPSGLRTVTQSPWAWTIIAVAILAVLLLPSMLPDIQHAPGAATSCTTFPETYSTHTPIRHVFWIVKENHAFENYFGDFPGTVGYPPTGSFPVSFNSSQTVSPYPLNATLSVDLPHDRPAELVDWNGGKNNNFVAEAASRGVSDPAAAVGYYTSAQIPIYYSYAQNFTLSDGFFTGVMGPTDPNRFFDITANVGNWTTDGVAPSSVSGFPSILDQLNRAGIPWNYDYGGVESEIAPLDLKSIVSDPCSMERVQPVGNITAQVDGPDPPAFTMVDVAHDFLISEHPPDNVTLGEAWTAGLVNAIAESPIASSSLILISWDEAGGFWDPVAPPQNSATGDGFRVPLIVISPWSPREIYHGTLDPSSVLNFVDQNWGLGTLNSPVANATPLGPLFNFSQTPRALPIEPTNITFLKTGRTVVPPTGKGSGRPFVIQTRTMEAGRFFEPGRKRRCVSRTPESPPRRHPVIFPSNGRTLFRGHPSRGQGG